VHETGVEYRAETSVAAEGDVPDLRVTRSDLDDVLRGAVVDDDEVPACDRLRSQARHGT